MTIDPNNLGANAKLTFSDEFNSLNLWNGGAGTWGTTYWWSEGRNGVTLATNGEQEWYIDANYASTNSVKPWTVDNGVLTISAAPASDAVKSLIDGYSYTSGMLNTFHSFSQTYGYFEMSAKLPAGQGIWPAFWLLPEDGSWPPELDVMEVLGNKINELVTTAHSNASGSHTQQAASTNVGDMSQGFHTYGVDWEADKITWFFDGKPIYSVATPADMHKPMYMLANLAVGGYWPGSADASTHFPAQMQIDYIRAYASGASSDVATVASQPAAGASASVTAVVTIDHSADWTAQSVNGTSANEFVQGGNAGDWINGSDGADTLNGRMGADTIQGGSGEDWVYGGKDNDVLTGDAGNDMVLGNLGDDTVDGGAGADIVRGGQGNDLLAGGADNDWLSGDRGADTMSGGSGADVFHTFAGAEVDLVLDFSRLDGDRVQVDGGLTWTVAQEGGDTVIHLSSGDEMILQNVQMSSLTGDWIFSA